MLGTSVRIGLLLALGPTGASPLAGGPRGRDVPAPSRAAAGAPGDELSGLVRISRPDGASCAGLLELESDCGRGSCKNSAHPSIDDSGARIAFSTDAERVVCASPNTDGSTQVYLRDVTDAGAERTLLISASCRDGGPAHLGGDFPRIAGDASCIVFSSWSADLIPHDRDEELDVFVHTLSLEPGLMGVTERISEDADGVGGNGPSGQPAVSRDGRFVAFISRATNLVHQGVGEPSGRARQILLVDRWASGAERCVQVSVGGDPGCQSPFANRPCNAPALSDGDPPRVAFHSEAHNLAAVARGATWVDENRVNDVFVRDVARATTLAVSASPEGAPGDGPSRFPAISADGRWVAFESAARNLLPAADTNGHIDVFVRDLEREETVRVSVLVDERGRSVEALGGPSVAPRISADGRFVVFSSGAANFLAGGVGPLQVFAHDRDGDGDGVYDEVAPGARRTWCLTPGLGGAPADGWSGGSPTDLTRDGRHAVFMSVAGNLVRGDGNGRPEVNPDRCCQRRAWHLASPQDCEPCCCHGDQLVPPCEWGRDVFRCRLY